MSITQNSSTTLDDVFLQIRNCTHCTAHLPFAPNPIVRGTRNAKILIVGQAPGTRVHHSSIPWNDASGDRLRSWMGLTKEQFYDEDHIAIMPMGFCYPGKGKTGDLPPRSECAPLWHSKMLEQLPDIQLKLLIGQYAHAYYLGKRRKANLTQTVLHWQEYVESGIIPLVHPSPRNRFWLANNPWFEKEVVPFLRGKIASIRAC